MGEPRLGIREPDDPREDSAARVRSERHDKVAQEVLWCLRVVEAAEAIEALQEIVDERRYADQVFSPGAGDEDVLGPQLKDLLLSLERTSHHIPRVSETPGLFHGNAGFPRSEVREREVRHVESGRAVLEHVDLVLRPKDAFLDWFRRLVLRDHALDRLDLGRLRFAEAFQGGPQHFSDRDALPRGSVARRRVSAARTLREEPPLPTRGTDPKADLHVDGLLRSGLEEQPLGPALVSYREERMRRRLHLPGRSLLRTGHPGADPGGAAGFHEEAGKGRRERERVRRLGPRREYEVRLVDGNPQGRHEHIRMPFDDQVAPADRIEDAQPDEPLSKFLVGGDDEPAFREASLAADAFAEELQILDGEVMEEQIVSRVKRHAEFPGP